jgi:hypothetical protein
VLEQVLEENRLIQTVPRSGAYKGKSVIAAPIQDADGKVVAAIGLSDAYGALDFIECFCSSPTIVEDVKKCLIERGVKVP